MIRLLTSVSDGAQLVNDSVLQLNAVFALVDPLCCMNTGIIVNMLQYHTAV